MSPGPGGGGREVLSPGPGGRGQGGRCCHLVPGGGREEGVVTWSQGRRRREVLSLGPWGGGREVLSPGARGEGGREVLSPAPGGREVLSPGPRGEGGRCCHLVPGGGRCCHLVLGGGEGGVVTWSPTSPPGVEVTHTCENITFARLATRPVIK